MIAEAAAVLVLEELEHAVARDASIYGEVVGYGTSSDANHVSDADRVGENAARALVLRADIPSDVVVARASDPGGSRPAIAEEGFEPPFELRAGHGVDLAQAAGAGLRRQRWRAAPGATGGQASAGDGCLVDEVRTRTAV